MNQPALATISLDQAAAIIEMSEIVEVTQHGSMLVTGMTDASGYSLLIQDSSGVCLHLR